METINVKSTDPTKVGIWEVNQEHPDGEVFVSGDSVVKVTRTAAVNRAIARGLIVEVHEQTASTRKTREPARKKTTPGGE